MSVRKNYSAKLPKKLESIAREKVENRFGLITHLIVYIAVNVLLLSYDHILTESGDWSYIPLFSWGIVLFIHGLIVIFGDLLSGWREKMVDKEVNRMKKKLSK